MTHEPYVETIQAMHTIRKWQNSHMYVTVDPPRPMGDSPGGSKNFFAYNYYNSWTIYHIYSMCEKTNIAPGMDPHPRGGPLFPQGHQHWTYKLFYQISSLDDFQMYDYIKPEWHDSTIYNQMMSSIKQ